ncbi:MAG TPA: hypothetical protein VGG61_04980 [Gemmataceae bacterium]|jgi:hypothetical protein
MARKPKEFVYREYPATNEMESGNKVGWRTYSTRTEAEACADAARHNAAHRQQLGYDFGYCSPGSIENRDGRFRVCIP